MFLWLFYGLLVILLRFVLGFIWSLFYLPPLDILANLSYLAMLVYAIYLATRSLFGENQRIPYISALADKLC